MRIVITLDKDDIKTSKNGFNYVITSGGLFEITLTPKALEEINNDIATILIERGKSSPTLDSNE